MKNLKIGKKLLLSFGVVVLLIILLGFSAFYGLQQMNSIVTAYSEKTVINTEYIWQIRRNVVSVQRLILNTIVAATPEEAETVIGIADGEADAFVQSLESYRSNMRTDPALLDAVEVHWTEAEAIRDKIEVISRKASMEANASAYELYKAEYLPVINEN